MTRLSGGGGRLNDARLLSFLLFIFLGSSCARQQGQRSLLQVGAEIPDGSARPLEGPTSAIAARPSAAPGIFGAEAPSASAPAPALATETLATGNETTRYSNGTCRGRGDFTGAGLFEGSGLFLSTLEGATIVGKGGSMSVSNFRLTR